MIERKGRCVFSLLLGLLFLAVISPAMDGFSFTDGEFQSFIIMNPAEAQFEPRLASALALNFELGDIGLQFASILSESGWDYFLLNAWGAIGSANFAADIRFLPMTPALDSAELQGILFAFGADLRATLFIEPGASGAITEIIGQSSDASILYGLKLFFNSDERGNLVDQDCHMTFSGAEVYVDQLGLPCCPELSINAKMTFTTAGFDALVFELNPVIFDLFPWITLNAELRYELEEKALNLRVDPNISAWEDCFSMTISFDYGASITDIAAISIDSLTMACEMGGISFEAVSYPHNGQRARMRLRSVASNLSERYWEWYRIWAEQDGCCGPFGFEVAFYFLEGGVRLFDVAAIQAQFSIQLASHLEFGSAIEFDFEIVGNQWVYWDLYFEIDF